MADEQQGFRKGRGCVDQIFAVKILVENTKRRIGSCLLLLWTWRRPMIELTGRAYGILRVYGVGGQLLEGIKSFYENASASVRVSGEFSG